MDNFEQLISQKSLPNPGLESASNPLSESVESHHPNSALETRSFEINNIVLSEGSAVSVQGLDETVIPAKISNLDDVHTSLIGTPEHIPLVGSLESFDLGVEYAGEQPAQPLETDVLQSTCTTQARSIAKHDALIQPTHKADDIISESRPDVQQTEVTHTATTGLTQPSDPAAEILNVAGTNGSLVSLKFRWTEREAAFNNEVGVFLVDDLGRVNGLTPDHPDYAHAALTSTSRQIIFASGQGSGSEKQLQFAANDKLAFYLIQNNTSSNWLSQNPQNRLGQGPIAFFSLNQANPDQFDHLQSRLLPDGVVELRWEDLTGGGDRDFNDVVFTIAEPGGTTPEDGPALIVPGLSGQQVGTKFVWVFREAAFNNEMGLFYVDDAQGRIGNLRPGDSGYAAAVLTRQGSRTIFASGQTSGATAEVDLPSGQYVGFYLIQNNTTAEFLRRNPQNQVGQGPLAFFFFLEANPDGIDHVQQTSNQISWEDLTGGGDRDFDDLIFQYEFGTPTGGLAQINISDISVVEGDSGTTQAQFLVELSQANRLPVSVNFTTADGTATAGNDYLSTAGTLVFAPGENRKFITIPIVGDTLSETIEQFSVRLSQAINASIADAEAIGTIQDNDTLPSLTIDDVGVVEGNSGTKATVFTARLSAASSQIVSVDYSTADGTATASADYQAATGKLVFQPGETSKTIQVVVNGDLQNESDETFSIELSRPQNAVIVDGTGIGTIQDDDSPELSISDVQILEGDSGTKSAAFTVRLSQASVQPVTVQFATTGDTATSGVDFQATSSTLTFAPGETVQTIIVPIVGDTSVEVDETFTVTLDMPTNAVLGDAQGIGTILNDDQAFVPSLSIADVTVVEGNDDITEAIFTVQLSEAPNQTVTVNFTTNDRTALAGLDYQAVQGTLTFNPGEALSQPIKVQIIGDIIDELDETFTLNLSDPTNAIIVEGSGVGTIKDDDLAGLSISDVSVIEGDSGTKSATFTVSLTNPISQPVSVNYATADGTALAGQDYETREGTVTFRPGEALSQTIEIPIIGDILDELDESFTLNLSSPQNAILVDDSGEGRILDDDRTLIPPTITANLLNDTGISNNDKLTIDPTVGGQITSDRPITSLQGRLNGQSFVDLSDALNQDNSFTLSLEQYERLVDGSMPDGSYTLELKGIDEAGQESDIANVSFILDRTAPPITFDLAPESDTGITGDKITTERTVNLVGKTEPGLTVVMAGTPLTATADSEGNFIFTDVAMPIAGKAPYTMVTVDAAGNQGRTQEFLTREGINGAPKITSTPVTTFDSTQQTTYTYQLQATDPDGDSLTYTLLNSLEGFVIDRNGLLSFSPTSNLLPSYELALEVSDGRGGKDEQTYTLSVILPPPSQGEIRGLKWDDLNANGIRDNSLEIIELINNSSQGYYNSNLGDLYPGNPTDPATSFFPAPNISMGDPTATFLSPPNLSTVNQLGNWITSPATAVTNGFWAKQEIPRAWDINTETTIIYEIDGGSSGINNVKGLFGVDNGIFIWVNGEYKFGAMASGGSSLGEYEVDFGDLKPGKNYIQILREDHGGFSGYDVSITSGKNTFSEPGLADVSVYLDLNSNGILDPDEPSQTTAGDNPDTVEIDETGQYRFTNLPPGTYTVREVVPPGYQQTFPAIDSTITIDFDDFPGYSSFSEATPHPGNLLESSGILISSVDSTEEIAVGNSIFLTEQTSDFLLIDKPFFSSPSNAVFPTQSLLKDVLLEFKSPVTSASLVTDLATAPSDPESDIVRFIALEKISDNEFRVLSFDETLDDFSNPIDATLSIASFGQSFSYALFQVTTEGELFDDLKFTTTVGGQHVVTLDAGEIVGNINFGNVEIQNQAPEIISEPITQITRKLSQGEPELIDLSTWSTVQYELNSQPDATWIIQPGNTEVQQLVNADASIFLGDFSLNTKRIEGTWRVDTRGDDDLMGFVFGYQDSQHFYLFDWKQSNQNDPLGFAEQGMSLKVVNADSPLTGQDFWPTSGNGERVKTLFHNTIPWADFTDYQFALDFAPGEFTITVSQGETILESFTIEDNTYTSGNFGFYNYSQGNVNYRGFTKTDVFIGEYFYDVEAVDADGDNLVYNLLEFPEGASIDSGNGEIFWRPTELGLYNFTVQVNDGNGGTDTQSFLIEVTNENQAPAITSKPITNAISTGQYRYQIRAFDGDGDTLGYTLITSPEGMSVNENGLIVWTPNQAGSFSIEFEVRDGQGGVATQSYTLNVTNVPVDTESPQIRLGLSSTVFRIGETLNLQLTATDNIGLTDVDLAFGRTNIALDPDVVGSRFTDSVSLTLGQAGVFEVLATATDIAGNIGRKTVTVRVIDPTDTTAPVVELDLSQFDPLNPVITDLTNLVGTVNDDLEFYRVDLAPLSLIDINNPVQADPNYITIATGTGNVDNGVLAQIDPNLYRNDTYYVRVYAQDNSGNINVQGVILGINSQNKPGEFSLEYTDLSIPLTGISIEVNRTYSSLNADFQGDFGYGWEMGLQDAGIIESSPTGIDLNFDDVFGGNSFTVGTRVTMNTPDGRRVGFTFDPTPQGGLLGTVWRPRFTADPGVYDTLSVENIPLTQYGDGSFGLYLFGLTYNPNQYQLTTKDGTVYNYDQRAGLQNVVDRNGNTLNFTDDGITSSTGAEIDFVRDSFGRITEIIDPAGESIRYTYDASGNLIGVSDRTNNVTTFKYDTDRDHYLNEVIDPLGRRGVRTEYADDGQISRIIDASGNALDINYDSAASRQTVKDPFGSTTTYIFDDRGNVVSEIDALGGVTARTYDANNNLTSETDPEGNTTTYTYDARGNVLTKIDPLGNITRTTYNTTSQILTEADPLGNTTTYTYNAQGNLTNRQDAVGKVTTYSYDQYGLLTKVIDANGNQSTFSYDDFGNLIQLIDPTGASTTFTYDANGRVASTTDALGAITNYIYDAQGRLLEKADPEGSSCGCARGITKTEYNAAGEKIAEIDALGRRTEYRYNERGLLIETIYPDATPSDLSDNPRSKNEYDALDRVIAVTDEAGRTTRYVYDKLGRQIEVVYADATPNDLTDNPRTKKEYDQAGRIIAEIDELGNRTELAYDKADRLISRTNALGEVTRYSYDADRRQVAMLDALGRQTTYTYDGLDRLTATTYANNSTMTKTYDALGRIIAGTDLAGKTTRYEYDALGRLTAVIDPLNQRTEYKYDAVGNLIEQKDAKGQVTKFEYDSLRRRKAMILPSGERSETIHNKIGNLIRTVDFNGVTTTYEYDDRNRLIQKSYSDGTPTETMTYTLTGELATVTDDRGVTLYSYDERDQLLSRTEPDSRTITYIYDDAGNVLSLTVPSGTTRYTYDALNRLDTVIDPDSGITDYTYDAVGNLIETEFPNGVVETQQYDLLDRLLYLENRNQTGILSSYTYSLDAMGNRTQVVENDGRTVQYEYDDLYRLTRETILDPVNGNRTIEYRFDPVGNRLERIDSVAGSTTYSYDINDRLLTETTNGQVTEYRYDEQGNLAARLENGQANATYEWNAKGEMVAVEITENGETGRMEFQYDHEGIRVEININGEETRFLVDKTQQIYAQVIEEYTSANQVKASYVHGLDLISQEQGSERRFYQVDGLGSTRTLTDVSGTVTDRYTYDAYGQLIEQFGNTSNNYLFAGEQFKRELGKYYLRARYYNPLTGRFNSRDAFKGYDDQPVTLHDYLYANANPVLFTDPSGNVSILMTAIKGAGLVGAVGAVAGVTRKPIDSPRLNDEGDRFLSAIVGFAAGAALGGGLGAGLGLLLAGPLAATAVATFAVGPLGTRRLAAAAGMFFAFLGGNQKIAPQLFIDATTELILEAFPNLKKEN